MANTYGLNLDGLTYDQLRQQWSGDPFSVTPGQLTLGGRTYQAQWAPGQAISTVGLSAAKAADGPASEATYDPSAIIDDPNDSGYQLGLQRAPDGSISVSRTKKKDNFLQDMAKFAAVGAGMYFGMGGLANALGEAGTASAGVGEAINPALHFSDAAFDASMSAADPVSAVVTGGATGAADAAGPGLTYDAFGDVIPNEAAATTQASQMAASEAANTANGLTATGGLTPEQYATMQQAIQTGAVDSLPPELKQIANQVANKGLGTLAGKALDLLPSTLATGLGSAYTADAARTAGQDQAAAVKEAAGILAPAATQAASLQAGAATDAAKTLSGAFTNASGVQSGAATQSGDMVANAALSSGNRLSDADLAAAKTIADAYKTSADQQVAGYQNSIGTAQQTLAGQAAIQSPYINAGKSALDQLTADLAPGGRFSKTFTMADAQNMPAYQFALDQGKQTINNAAAAGGMQLSSANLESLGKFAEGTAAQYEQQAFNQWLQQNNLTLGALQNMVSTGQISTQQLQQALAQAGVSMETAQQNIGIAQGAGTLGAGKATAAGTLGSAYALSEAEKAAAQAKADALNKSAGFTAGGILGSGAATAAGQTASAGYTAGGITGAANANAAGVIGASNANTAGKIGSTNVLTSGLSSIGNSLSKSGILGNIPKVPDINRPESTNRTSPIVPQYSLADAFGSGAAAPTGGLGLGGAGGAMGQAGDYGMSQIPMNEAATMGDFNLMNFA